jgi:hypothetical protein
MARGWESKDVAEQVETKEEPKMRSGKPVKTDEEVQRDTERGDFELSRVRIAHDLEVATNPNHRKSLEAALAHLDKKITALR